MNKTLPWHQMLTLRDEIRERTLAVFAADLYDVVMQQGKMPLYEEPEQFFGVTHVTGALKSLARDVMLRLAGQSDKAVRQLAETYGGGKTHALITLRHLVTDPEALPQETPAVQEFLAAIAPTPPPRARVAVLLGDRTDVERGMEARSPSGELRRLRLPWSILAWQLAGENGLRLLHPQGLAAERDSDSPPTTDLLESLLALPAEEGLATLLLMDEVLTYARQRVEANDSWQSILIDFFQFLTQAVTRTPRCALVVSLLSKETDDGELSRRVQGMMDTIFGRLRDSLVQPVGKDDVAEVLRRILFTPESVEASRAKWPAQVTAAVKGIVSLNVVAEQDSDNLGREFKNAYPFHPDLTDIFYSQWVSLEGFQQARGVLRVFAQALRASEGWDFSPIVGPGVFLNDRGKPELAEAATELANIAKMDEYEGRKQKWDRILASELAKAGQIQKEFQSLQRGREVEQAVMATFLYSQPIGRKARREELLRLLGPTQPDAIELDKALRNWVEVSWYLDETESQGGEVGAGGLKALPKFWRLGFRPNLKQMHHDACDRVNEAVLEDRVLKAIGTVKELTQGAVGAGAKVHSLPDKPSDIPDDGQFRFGVLRPNAASEPGKPSTESRRFLEQTTGPDRPRQFGNAVVLAVPSRTGLSDMRQKARAVLGWEEVRAQFKAESDKQDGGDGADSAARLDRVKVEIDKAETELQRSIRLAYNIVVTRAANGEVQAFQLNFDDASPLFTLIQADERSRIQDAPVTAATLLPDGPYNLWRGSEAERGVQYLVQAFAERPDLPKMLNQRAIIDTLVQGCRDGLFVLELRRSDGAVRDTFWRENPDPDVLDDKDLYVVLPEAVEGLKHIRPELLTPGSEGLRDLWSGPELRMGTITAYFSGTHSVEDPVEGPLTVPKAERDVLNAAVSAAVQQGLLWLTSGPASLLREEVPPSLLSDAAVLQEPPPSVSLTAILPEALPDAWQGKETTVTAIKAALNRQTGKNLPWALVKEVVDSAYRARILEHDAPGLLPQDWATAQAITLRVPSGVVAGSQPTPQPEPVPHGWTTEADLQMLEVQELADQIGALKAAATDAELELEFRVRITLCGSPSPSAINNFNDILAKVTSGLHLSNT